MKTKLVKEENKNITTVASKTGYHAAVLSKNPKVTWREIEDGAEKGLKSCTKDNIVKLPKEFDIEIEYVKPTIAYSASFFPGCKLINSDTVSFHATNFYDVLVMFKFIL